MLPEFSPGGLLPPSASGEPYSATIDEIRIVFVEPFPDAPWRLDLFRQWALVRAFVESMIPGARWWLWGCFVSNHEEPLFGEYQSLSSLVFLPPVVDLSNEQVGTLIHFLQGAEERRRVDVAILFNEIQTQSFAEAVAKWRRRAQRGVAHHMSKELVDCGFVEVSQ